MWPFRKKKEPDLYYSEHDMTAFESMVSERFGAFREVAHEIASPDLHIDVIIIPPSPQKDYYTLITMGMGAYPMPVPAEYKKRNRAEVAIRLPKDWKIKSYEEKWYWPIRMLKVLARMPYYEKSWLGLYHDVDFGDPFCEDTELCGILLDIFDRNAEPFTLENGDQLIVYNALPIYRSEMEYKNEKNAQALIAKLSDEVLHGPVDIHRERVI